MHYIFLSLSIFVIVYLFRTNWGIVLTSQGQFEKAIAWWHKRLKKWSNRESLKPFAYYHLANCHAWLGNYQESLQWLEKMPMEKVPPRLSSSIYYLKTLNLFFLEAPRQTLKQYFPAFKNDAKFPQYALLAAYILKLEGDEASSRQIFENYKKNHAPAEKNFSLTVLRMSKKLRHLQENFFLGAYALKSGDKVEAKALLGEVASAEISNCYSQQAEKLLSL